MTNLEDLKASLVKEFWSSTQWIPTNDLATWLRTALDRVETEAEKRGLRDKENNEKFERRGRAAERAEILEAWNTSSPAEFEKFITSRSEPQGHNSD